MTLLWLSSRKVHLAKSNSLWFSARRGTICCKQCTALLKQAEGLSVDIDLDISYFSVARVRLGRINVGPIIHCWDSPVQVLRRDFVEVLSLRSDDFIQGKVTIGGCPADAYVSIAAQQRVWVTIRPTIVATDTRCAVCGRHAIIGDLSSELWVRASDIRDRAVLANEFGGGPYVIDSVYENFTSSLKKELEITDIAIR